MEKNRKKKFISIDIGGTAIKYGMINESGIIELRGETDTEAHRGGVYVLEKAVKIVKEYQNNVDLIGICISTAGMVDPEMGRIFYSGPQIPHYAGTDFKRTMEQIFRVPCEVENDVNCAGLAESISGAAAGCKSVLCLTVGTGIGGCFIRNCQIFHGHGNSACEVGYLHMGDSDFQTLGSARALIKKVAERKGEKPEMWNGIKIFEAAKEGDGICRRSIEEMADVLGQGIANICYILNPQAVVLGGGIMSQKEYLYPLIRSCLDKYLIPQIAKKTDLKMAAHKNDAGLLGAYYNFCNRHKNRC